MCTPENDVVNVETCREIRELKIILRNCIVIGCIVILNNAMGYNGAQLNIKRNDSCFYSMKWETVAIKFVA
jgi:hypothetical protein